MKFQASLPTVSCVLAYPRFPAIMLWGPLPSLICVYIAVCLSLPWFQPLPCQETGIPLWPSVTGWPVAFHICVHTPTPDQNSTLTICWAVQDAATVVLKRKIIDGPKAERAGDWMICCLSDFNTGLSHLIYCVVISPSIWLYVFSAFPSLSSLTLPSPLQQFPIKIRPQHGGKALLHWLRVKWDLINGWELIGYNK